MAKAKRQSGIELLRIIIMFQIVILHLYVYGNLTDHANRHGGVTNFFFDGVWVLGRMPVDVFVLIMGYFMVSSEMNLKKTFIRWRKVYVTMLFYSLVLGAVYFLFIRPEETPKAYEIIKLFMPFTSRRWYFLSAYLVVLALSPFLNVVLQQLTKKQYLIFMGIVFFVMSVWSTLAKVPEVNKVISISKIVDSFMGKSVGGFLLMYIVGGYLRRFTTEHKKPQLKFLAIFFACCAADLALHLIFPKHYVSGVFGQFNNPLVVIEAAVIFLFFRDMHFYSGVINAIAATTIGIYAIHEFSCIRYWLWELNFENERFAGIGLPQGYLAAFGYCVLIFVVCSLLDMLRQRLFDGVAMLYQKSKNKKTE